MFLTLRGCDCIFSWLLGNILTPICADSIGSLLTATRCIHNSHNVGYNIWCLCVATEEKSAFKLKRTSDKAVVFQMRKKEAAPTKTSFSKGRFVFVFYDLKIISFQISFYLFN